MPVLFDHNLGSVWSRSGGSANGIDSVLREAAWLSPEHRCRAERMRQAKMLFDGRHREYFLDEGRTSDLFPPLKEGQPAFFRPFNLLTLAVQKVADLIVSEPPTIKVENDALQITIDQITERSWLGAVLQGAVVECGWAGDTFLEVLRVNGEAVIGHVPANEIFPIGLPGSNHQYGSYVRYATALVGGAAGTKPQQYLLETYYKPGLIERKCFAIEPNAVGALSRGQAVTLDKWPARDDAGQPLADSVTTGLEKNSLIYVPNSYAAISDFDGLIDVQDTLHAKNTQIARVLAEHADPKLAAPEAAADENGNLPVGAKVYYFRDKSEIPAYITWNAELASAIEDRRFALQAFATIAETPLSFLGIKDDASVESAKKVRLNAGPALGKAARKTTYWRAALRMALQMAIEIDTGARETETIGVTFADGLPTDPAELSLEISNLRSARVISLKRALEKQNLDPTAVEDELKELEQEARAATPSILFGDPNAPATSPAADPVVA